jgi:hypothetical protein
LPGNSDPSRIYHDPALTDRRGDATGPGALLFLFLLVAAFAVAAVGLVSLPALVSEPDPTARPATPAPVATARPTATPAVPASPGASTEPTIAPDGSTGPDATGEPQPTVAPDGSTGPDASGPLPTRRPQPTPDGRPATQGALGETVPVFVNGKRTGGVAVLSFKVGDLAGVDLPAGARIMVMQVRYSTAFGMAYDASDWVVVDADGKRYRSLGDQAPIPALGSGTLAAGGSVTGNVAFIRQLKVSIEQIVLTDGKGHDLVSVARATPGPSSAP